MIAPSHSPEARELVERVRKLLEFPRESGSDEANRARDAIAALLTRLGYQVETQRFSFSPSGLLGFPLFGAGLGWLTLLQIPLLVLPGVPGWAALLVWSAGLLSLTVLATGLALGWGTLGSEVREDANLIATRGGKVTRWIVAHYDTKAQGHSMAGRMVAVWGVIAASLFMTGLAIGRLTGPLPIALMAAGAATAMAAGYLAGRGRIRGTSHGARDNGSGLLTALLVAQGVDDPAVGILITGAEEFGLIGARYLAEKTPGLLPGTRVINIDTVDEQGAWRLVTHSSDANGLAQEAETALTGVSAIPIRRHRLPAGIFVDSLPLARAGAIAITMARLDWGTLRKIHTPRDTLEGLSLDSAVLASDAIKQMITV